MANDTKTTKTTQTTETPTIETATIETATTEIPTGILAVVGAGDFAVEQVRAAMAVLPAVAAQFESRVSQVQADVQKRAEEFDPKAYGAKAQELPQVAAATLLQNVSKAQLKAEATYEGLAERGAKLIDQIRRQPSTEAFVKQTDTAVSRAKAAVTVARRAADETLTSVRGTISVGKREVEAVVETTQEAAEASVTKTTGAAKKSAGTAKKGADATTSAAKGARTSARKSAAAARTAAKDAAAKVGD